MIIEKLYVYKFPQGGLFGKKTRMESHGYELATFEEAVNGFWFDEKDINKIYVFKNARVTIKGVSVI